jgi:hypothetical protein
MANYFIVLLIPYFKNNTAEYFEDLLYFMLYPRLRCAVLKKLDFFLFERGASRCMIVVYAAFSDTIQFTSGSSRGVLASVETEFVNYKRLVT